MERPNVSKLIFPEEYLVVYIDEYYHPFSGRRLNHIMELDGYGMCPDVGMELTFKGIDIRTDEEIYDRYNTVDSMFDYPINHPIVNDNDVLFVNKKQHCTMNSEVVKENKITLEEVKDEYLRLKAEGLTDAEINKSMIETYQKPLKAKVLKK